jgi:hypothetical protein
MAWAEDRATCATRPERRPRDQDRRGRHDAALPFPFGIGTKAVNRFYVHQFSLLLISRHQFLHFTVNQYTMMRVHSRGTFGIPAERPENRRAHGTSQPHSYF